MLSSIHGAAMDLSVVCLRFAAQWVPEVWAGHEHAIGQGADNRFWFLAFSFAQRLDSPLGKESFCAWRRCTLTRPPSHCKTRALSLFPEARDSGGAALEPALASPA
jgi:hypothetical protein